MAVTNKHSLHSIHSWWKTQELRKIESGPKYKTAAHAFVLTLRLGLRAPFRPKLLLNQYSIAEDHKYIQLLLVLRLR